MVENGNELEDEKIDTWNLHINYIASEKVQVLIKKYLSALSE